MQRNLTPFARKVRQFRRLAKEVGRLLDSGRFHRLAEDKQRSLVSKLRTLYRKLSRTFPTRQLRGAMGAASLVLGLGMSQQVQAQNFGPAQATPFNFTNTTEFNLPTFADIDDDGDLDLLSTGYIYGASDYLTLRFYQNVGTSAVADFQAPVELPYGISDLNIFTPSFVDIDDDGDLDAFLPQAGYGNFLFRENTGTAAVPAFAPVPETNPFGLVPVAYFPIASFVDLDNDGDLDLFATEFYGNAKYFENTGTASAPAFAAPVSNPFGVVPPAYAIVRTFDFSDVDLDGDQDMIYYDLNGDYDNSAVFYSENTGTASAPAFAAGLQAPSGIFFNGGYLSQPAFADIDGDGDEDLFFGTYMTYGGLVYFENLGVPNSLPITTDAEVTTGENVPYSFAAGDFPFDDADTDDMLEGIRIASLPGLGSLTFDGNPAVENLEIPIAEIDKLIYTSLPNEFGDNYDSFGFQVFDGVGYSAAPAVMTIDVLENVGTTENSLNVKAMLSPNPATESVQLALSFRETPGELTFSVVDALGKVQKSWTQQVGQTEFQTTLNVADLSPGMYLMHLRAGDRLTTLRFVKN
ncbi:MAG: T9SS type A sorting domain-containing protein [Saprospirales bacterium]|nr:T9SS type A sorting domain-containing protein [Saprospirales bacterium]